MKMFWNEIWMEKSVVGVFVCVFGGGGGGRGRMKVLDQACPNLRNRGNLPEPTRQFQPRKS